MTEKIINCGNCKFCEELSWGFLRCKISGEYVGCEQLCEEWEDEYNIVSPILKQFKQRIDLK